MKISNPKVAEVFRSFPEPARARLMVLRALIFDTAAKSEGIGDLEETIKWGEPAYRARGGSTIRLGWKARSPREVAMYFICTTNLVARFRMLYPECFRFGGNRSLLFDLAGSIPEDALRHCIGIALTYHRR